MLFHSLIYLLLFLPSIFIIYFLLRKFSNNDGKILLIFSGLIFYGWWNIKFTPLIIFSVLFNYFLSKKIAITEEKNKKKIILLSGIFCNVIYLGIFKYTDFVIENLNYFFELNIETFNLPFPLAMRSIFGLVPTQSLVLQLWRKTTLQSIAIYSRSWKSPN